jgi:hypothetical protein
MNRVCKKCGEEKKETKDNFSFEKGPDGKFRFRSTCIKCRTKITKENNWKIGKHKPMKYGKQPKEEMLAKKREWEEKNHDKVKQYALKTYYKNHEKRVKMMNEKYHLTARAKGIRSMDEIKANKKTFKEREEYKRNWENNNPEKYLPPKIKYQINKTYGIDKERIPEEIVQLKVDIIIKNKIRKNEKQ